MPEKIRPPDSIPIQALSGHCVAHSRTSGSPISPDRMSFFSLATILSTGLVGVGVRISATVSGGAVSLASALINKSGPIALTRLGHFIVIAIISPAIALSATSISSQASSDLTHSDSQVRSVASISLYCTTTLKAKPLSLFIPENIKPLFVIPKQATSGHCVAHSNISMS